MDDDMLLDFGPSLDIFTVDISKTGAKSVTQGGTWTAAMQQTLTLGWETWEPKPVPGDLVVVLSTRRLTGSPPGWVTADQQVVYAVYDNSLQAPVLTAESAEGAAEWAAIGYIAVPQDGYVDDGSGSWQTSVTS